MAHTDTHFRTANGTPAAAKSLVTMGGDRYLHLANMWPLGNVSLTSEERDLLVEGYVLFEDNDDLEFEIED